MRTTDARRALVSALSAGGTATLYRNVPSDLAEVRGLLAAWRGAYLDALRRYHGSPAAVRDALHAALASARSAALARAPWLAALIDEVGGDTVQSYYLFTAATFATAAAFPARGGARSALGGRAVPVEDATASTGFETLDAALVAMLRALESDAAARRAAAADVDRAERDAVAAAVRERANLIGMGLAEPVTVAATARDRTLLDFRWGTRFEVEGLRVVDARVVEMVARRVAPTVSGPIALHRVSLDGLPRPLVRRAVEDLVDARLVDAAKYQAFSRFAG